MSLPARPVAAQVTLDQTRSSTTDGGRYAAWAFISTLS
jgi:hypothetical protein